MGSIVCTSFVHDCIHLFSSVHLLLFFLSRGGGLGTCYPPFSDFGFENGLNRLSFVCTRLSTSSFVCTPLTFSSSTGGGGGLGTCYAPFLILDSKMDSIVSISFVYDCTQLFSFVHLILFSKSVARTFSKGGQKVGIIIFSMFTVAL